MVKVGGTLMRAIMTDGTDQDQGSGRRTCTRAGSSYSAIAVRGSRPAGAHLLAGVARGAARVAQP